MKIRLVATLKLALSVVFLCAVFACDVNNRGNGNSHSTNIAPESQKPALSKDEYNRLKLGTSYSDAVKIIGDDGIEYGRSGGSRLYRWIGEDSRTKVLIEFENDKIVWMSCY